MFVSRCAHPVLNWVTQHTRHCDTEPSINLETQPAQTIQRHRMENSNLYDESKIPKIIPQLLYKTVVLAALKVSGAKLLKVAI